MQLEDLQLIRDTLEKCSSNFGTPWLPDKHHSDMLKCLRLVRKEIRAIADTQRKQKNANQNLIPPQS